MKKLIILLFLLKISLCLSAQTLTQTIRGKVTNKEIQEPLPNVSIQLLGTELSTISDKDGSFKFSDVPVGRYILKATILGYKPTMVPCVIVSSRKELILAIEMEESVIELKEVAVTVNKGREFYLSETSSISSRVFSIDDAERFAGSFGDPVRMVANYAGVVSMGDKRNDLVIRGNSPMGLLWKFEGVEIPNPNHFGGMTNGGGVSILNTNILANSNFITGAFSAEYGNATSGVFDLKMRNGNDEKYEFSGEVGFSGFQVGAEGPISKQKQSSFLVNYRYSAIDAVQKLGVNFGSIAVPKYQDLAFKLYFPLNPSSNITWFGIAGISNLAVLQKTSGKGDGSFSTSGKNYYFDTNVAVSGISYFKSFSENSSLKLTFSSTLRNPTYTVDSVNTQLKLLNDEYFMMNDLRTNLQINWSKKWNNQWSSRTGVVASRIDFNMQNKLYRIYGLDFGSTYNSTGNTYFIQGFTELKQKPSDRFTFNYGIHYQQLFLNNHFSIEPRISSVWNVSENNTFSLSAGMHSQMQPLYVYFRKIINTDKITNRDIDFSKSLHAVFGYDRLFRENWKLKAEAYYQYLYDIPVQQRFPGFSLLNQGADFAYNFEDKMISKGTGRNYGIELTLEKFFSKNYYFLFTSSLYNSLYTPIDGKERNTAYNGNYVVNILGGIEQPISADKNKKLKVDYKLTYAGGKRYTPLDITNPYQTYKDMYFDDQLYSKKYKDYFRADLKVSFRKNGKKVAQNWTVDIQNIFNTKNIFDQSIDKTTNSIKTEYLLGVFPTFGYQIEF